MNERQRVSALWVMRDDPFIRELIRSDVAALKRERWEVLWHRQEVPHAMARAQYAWAAKLKKWRLWVPD